MEKRQPRPRRLFAIAPAPAASGLAQPIFADEALDAPELRFIVGDDDAANRHGMSGDKQVIGADGLTGSLKPGADQAIGFVGRRLERNDVKRAKTASS